MAFGPAVDVPGDAGAAAWLGPALGEFGTVGGVVPPGFERHLVIDFDGRDVVPLFEELAPLLAAHTRSPDACWFAIGEGYGFLSSTTLVARRGSSRLARWRERGQLRAADARRHQEVAVALSTVPTFDLPHRRYYLVQGPVAAASTIRRPDGDFPQPPDLWWPDDRTWFVGGDTDLDWCYVGGSSQLASVIEDEFSGHTRPVDPSTPNHEVGNAS